MWKSVSPNSAYFTYGRDKRKLDRVKGKITQSIPRASFQMELLWKGFICNSNHLKIILDIFQVSYLDIPKNTSNI